MVRLAWLLMDAGVNAGCSPLLAQTASWWSAVLGYHPWCFALLVGFADSAAAQPRLLRSLGSFADLCVLTGSTWKLISAQKFLRGGCIYLTPGGVISAAGYVDDLIAFRLFK